MDRIKSVISSRFYDEHYKTKVHIGQLALVTLMFVFSGVRIANKPAGVPVSRSDTIGIVMVSYNGRIDSLLRQEC